MELVTKTRTEHLSQQDKERSKKVIKTPLESFLGAAEEHINVVTNGVSMLSLVNMSIGGSGGAKYIWHSPISKFF